MKTQVAALLTALTMTFGAPGQSPEEEKPRVVEVPRCVLTPKEMVDIVASWDIKHEPGLITRADEPGLQYWGLTEPSENLITLSNKPALPVRKMVVIHEFIHACYRNIGLSIPKEFEEHFVQIQADEMYKELYGNDK